MTDNEFDIKRMVMACDLEMEAIPVYRKAEAFAQLNKRPFRILGVGLCENLLLEPRKLLHLELSNLLPWGGPQQQYICECAAPW